MCRMGVLSVQRYTTFKSELFLLFAMWCCSGPGLFVWSQTGGLHSGGVIPCRVIRSKSRLGRQKRRSWVRGARASGWRSFTAARVSAVIDRRPEGVSPGDETRDGSTARIDEKQHSRVWIGRKKRATGWCDVVVVSERLRVSALGGGRGTADCAAALQGRRREGGRRSTAQHTRKHRATTTETRSRAPAVVSVPNRRERGRFSRAF